MSDTVAIKTIVEASVGALKDQADMRQEVRETCRGWNRRLKKPALNYSFEVLPLPKDEGGGYAITFPELPGFRSEGKTPEKAIANGPLSWSDWRPVATKFEGAIPVPFSSLSGRFVQRVPRSLHRQLVDEAKTEGVSINTLVVSLVAEGLDRRHAVWPASAVRSSVRSARRHVA